MHFLRLVIPNHHFEGASPERNSRIDTRKEHKKRTAFLSYPYRDFFCYSADLILGRSFHYVSLENDLDMLLTLEGSCVDGASGGFIIR